MLEINGRAPSAYCDGVSRRAFLRVGSLGVGALALPEILRRQARAESRSKIRGVIKVLLPGGPSHLDMFDLKPDAPAEVRGEFRPIETRVAGLEICELMPRLATMADKFTIIRSLVGFRDDHNTHWCTTGWESHPAMDSSPIIAGFPPGDWPSLGAVLSKQFGPRVPGVPPSVDLTPIDPNARFILRTPPGQPGYLGPAHAGFEVNSVDRRNIQLSGVGLNQLRDRRTLLASFDQFRRGVDRTNEMVGLDEFHRQAFEVLTSPRLAEALDLSREDAETRGRYGLNHSFPNERDGKTFLDQFLLARRVIEAGARCVTLAFSRYPFGRMLRGDFNWDWHKDIFPEARATLPLFDWGMSALIADLEYRGLLDEVAVVAWGEFGRTPKINANAGRDHWPSVGTALVAGGGLRMGQVIGETTRWGEQPKRRPVHFREVFATLYHQLGIDVARTQMFDLAGRPQYLVGEHRPLPEFL
jgi:hypothetical protein